MAKKKTRRSKAKHPALKPELNLKSRYELIDYDYLNKLSEEELDFLNRFSEEWINANLNHKGETLHNTPELKKDCYSRNNARNRCLLTKAKASGNSVDLETIRKTEKKKMGTKDDEKELIKDIDDFVNLDKIEDSES